MSKTWLVITGMTLVTFLPRIAPILLLPGRKMPKAAERWLSLIAPGILAALLVPELFLDRSNPAGPILALSGVYLKAALPTFIVAWKTKNLFMAVVTGVTSAALLRLF